MAKKKLNCPICSKPVIERENPHFPFCSERCKLVDLEAWLGGKYYVPGEPTDVHRERSEDNKRGGGEGPSDR